VADTDLVTIVVTDWVDSTATRSRLGEERADELQRVHDRLLRESVAQHAGTVVKGSGDGVLATFHSATLALDAAVSLQQRFDGYSRSPGAPAAVSLRIGISAGDVVHQDGDIFGTPVVEAARLEGAADPGQILCSEMVRMLARGRGGHQFELIGMLELKGLPEPLPACSVRWERAREAGASTVPLPPELSTGGSMRFIGRDEEVHGAITLSTEVEQAHALWVLGEPGIGKTRLATEVAARAHVAGALVLFGRCDENVAAPFQPVIQALRWHVGTLDDDELAAALGVDPEPLARLAPEIRARLPGLSAGVAPTSESEQYRLFDAVRSWLGTTAATRPVVFVVDDAHWADRPTIALLAHVLRGAQPARLLVIGTARDTKPDVSDPLTNLIDELHPTRRSRAIRLHGLSSADVVELVHAAQPGDAAWGLLAERIAEDTAGNPLFVGAVLAGLMGGEASSASAGELPADVGAAVRRRVRRLPAPVQELLQVASLVGLEFRLRVVADAAGVAETESLTRVEQAVGAGLVHELSVDRFRFTHALVRDALVGELSASRQARLHAAVAASIETRYAGSLDEHLPALARHYASAGDERPVLEKALDYAVRSARRALELLAFDAAVDDYRIALDLTERIGDRPLRDRFELLIAQGEAERLAAAHGAALATLRKAAGLAREERDWEALARIAIAFEEASWRPGLLGHDAVELLHEADAHAAVLSPRRAILVRASLGRALHYAGRAESAVRVVEDAVAAARELGDLAVLAFALTASGQTRAPMRAADLDVVIDRAEEVWRLRDQVDDPDLIATAAEYASVACLSRADRDGALRWLDRLREATERLGSRFSRFVLLCKIQVVTFLDGDLVEAERQADANLEFGRQLGEDVSGVHGVQLFLIRREQDRLVELVPVVRMLLQLNPAAAMWRPGLVVLLAEVGMADDARRLLLDLAADDFGALPRDNLFPAALCFLAEAAFQLGAATPGREVETLLEPWAGSGAMTGHLVGHLGAIDRYLGLLAWLDGRLDDAELRLEAALDFNRRLGAVIWEAHSLVDLAMLGAARDEIDASRECRVGARDLAERHGLAAVGRRLDALGPGRTERPQAEQ
jgi:class 3 adenylate cyclase/tetratricopeptide (TPR) repeat protein